MQQADKDKPGILSQNLFPVVGIGASAGGLEAFKKLIKGIPENSGMSYILVQHLAPEHESALPEILQRITKIPVVEISDNVNVAPDHIYVIPPNKILIATDGVLKLSPRVTGKINMPIDIFLSSLAEIHQAYAIGVVLSGTGKDGTAGLKDIKDNGGLTFAQDLDSAAYEGMPQHAIESEVVDFILPPEKIPERLIELQQTFTISSPENELVPKDKANEDAFRQILALLRVRVGVDFSFYKQTTIRRRIIRRMVMLKLESVPDYFDHLKKNKPEQDILFNDFLISVTSFFRDPKTFDLLSNTVFPEILKNKSVSNPLRIWIAGCCTGQEAYSIAISLHEYLSDHITNIKVQIFATDISDKSIKKARIGVYSKKELDGLSDNQLHQFFNKINGHYQVKKLVRDMCVFATHNFLKDPPFAKMDLISCRNVLIYLEPFLQKKVFSVFHYALNDKGILWLGKSETTGNGSELFIPFGKKEKFYARKSIPGRFTNVIGERSEMAFTDNNYSLRSKEGKTDDFQKSADHILLSKYTPAGVIVNEQFDIVQFRGSTGKYLEPSPGKASLNVLKMAKEGLAFEIRNALHKAKAAGEPFVKDGIAINDEDKLVTIEVIPLLDTIDLHFLILFSQQASTEHQQRPASGKGKSIAAKNKTDEKDALIQQLRKELAQAREDMRGITEEQEAANEELQSSNEELLSGSEELQSLNEELETSKEELQSTNEELITVNQELYDSNDELNKSRRFAEASISILHEPLLVLDKRFIIRSANASFYTTFKLTEDETLGKILFELQNNGWDIPGVRKELEKIQKEKEKRIEIEIAFTFPVIGERIICFNIQPINNESGEQLILLALDDVTSKKNAAQLLEDKASGALKERQVLHNFFMQTPAMLCILKGPEHVFEFANPLYRQFIGNRQVIGKKLIEALPEVKGQGFLEILNEVYRTGDAFTGKEIPVSVEDKKEKSDQYFVNYHYQAFKDDEGATEGILVFAYDVTEQVIARRQLELNAAMIHNLYMNAPGFICTLMGPEHTYTLVNPSYQKLFGKREIVGKPIMVALPELEGQGFDKILDHVYETGETYVGIEIPITLARDEALVPEERYFNFSYQPIYQEEKKINGILVFGYEVTEEIRGKKIQQESAGRFRILADAMPQKVWTADANGNVNYFNRQWFEYTHKSFEDLKDWGWKEIIYADDWDINQQSWQHSINTGEAFQLEHRFLFHDGTYRWHLSRGVAQKDNDGKIMMWVGTNTDIHEQKLFEMELEKQIAARIEIEREKNDFISMASHELKTPLTSLKGYTQSLQRKFKNEGNAEAEPHLLKMDKQINKLTALINDLLDSTKVTRGQLKFNEELFDFNELIKEIAEEMRQTSKRHTITINLDASEMIYGDRNRIGQVMTNMLSNAIKYSPKADHIIITTKHENNNIRFCVQDFGIGIPQEKESKVFEQFFRVSGDVQENFSGLGLGLFIASEIIKRHKGNMSVDSIEGKGSTFCFILPIPNV
jgi:PAS domain S-box-containing protein